MNNISKEQALSMAALFQWADEADHFEFMETPDVDDIHIKEFRLDGQVQNWFIADDGEITRGGVGAWGVVKAVATE